MSAPPAGPTRSWRPGFYPAETKPNEFLGRYAERLPSVELNSTGYRLPAEEQFSSWAEQTPDTFRFAVKMQAYQLRQAATFEERVRLLGDAARPDPDPRHPDARRRVPHVRARVARPGAEDRVRLPARVVGRRRAAGRTRSWSTRWRRKAPFRYLRFRDPPYTDKAIERIADDDPAARCERIEVFAYFQHEDEPTAPHYAERLLELL